MYRYISDEQLEFELECMQKLERRAKTQTLKRASRMHQYEIRREKSIRKARKEGKNTFKVE